MPPSPDVLGFAIVGCGMIARFHARALADVPGTRVAALVSRRHARAWLLDEPHAALDAAGRDVLDVLVSEAAGREVAVVVASHEAERARPLAHRVVTLAGGRVVSDKRLEREPAVVA